ncbi:MAG: DUF6868 family protein [Gammaproteobacteria bacterium]
MSIEELIRFLGWCGVINIAVLLYWFLFMVLAHDWVYRLHSRWFKISRETFDATQYAAMAYYKLATFLFTIIPYLVLRFML